MFLRKLFLTQGIKTGSKEGGSALIGVMGVMGVVGVIAVTITSMSLHALGYSTSTRAGVQAQAAAEAGIDYAAAGLATALCKPTYSSTTDPIFTVTVAYSTLATSPGDTDTSWVTGCPSTPDAKRLKLVSTGSASASGVSGNSSQNVRRVEAIYVYTPPSYAITPSGAAIYAYAQTDPTINNLTLTQASTARPSIQYLSGSATCNADTTTINGDVILGAGALSLTSGCTINGDLWASNTVDMQSGEVTGNVTAAGVVGGTSVSLTNPATIDGNVYAAGPVSIKSKVGGNIVSGPTTGTSTFTSQASVGGSVIAAGTVSAPAGVIKGTITANKSGIVTPTIPFVPGWVDFAYNPSDWKNANGTLFTVLTMTACDATTLANSLITAQNSLSSIILDTRVCGVATNLAGYNLTLKSDTVIIANGFNLSGNDFESSDTTDKRLWLILPDTVADKKPTCPTGSYTKIVNHVTVGPHVGSLIYSPCPIANSGDVWRGQMYSSSVGSSASMTLSYLPLGLPSVNLSTGQAIPPPVAGTLGDRQSIRDLNGG